MVSLFKAIPISVLNSKKVPWFFDVCGLLFRMLLLLSLLCVFVFLCKQGRPRKREAPG